MADFGDDVGDMLLRSTEDFLRRFLQNRQRKEKSPSEIKATHSSITIQGENEAAAVAKALTDKGIPFEIARTSLSVEQNGEIGSRLQFQFAEEDLPVVQTTVKEALEQYKMQMRESMPDLGRCSISIDDTAQAERIARDLESAGITYEVHRTALNLNTRVDKEGNSVSSLSERTEFTFAEKDYDVVKDIAKRSIDGRATYTTHEQNPVYMNDIETIVHDAVERSGGDPEQFINICREQGLEVGEASDGTLKFTHPNGWFEVRADTLSERMENSREHEAFERGVGEKSEDLSQQAVEEQERYIQSHDGGDIDTRTRVNESVTKTRPERMERERPKKEYDLDSEARDMRSASKALDSGRGVKEIGPQER